MPPPPLTSMPAPGGPIAVTPGFRRILIRELYLDCAIGVLDSERGRRQKVIISVDLFVADDGTPPPDDIAAVVSYAEVVEAVRQICAGDHIDLVETLAERVAAAALADPRVDHVRVLVEKPDIIHEAAAVGVAIERRRP